MGRKAAWWSPILLGVWDEQQGNFVAMCKCMSGVSPFILFFYRSLVRIVRAHPVSLQVLPMRSIKRSTNGTLLEVKRVRPPHSGMWTPEVWLLFEPFVVRPPPPDEWQFIGYHPSVYFKPSEVWEIRGAE